MNVSDCILILENMFINNYDFDWQTTDALYWHYI